MSWEDLGARHRAAYEADLLKRKREERDAHKRRTSGRRTVQNRDGSVREEHTIEVLDSRTGHEPTEPDRPWQGKPTEEELRYMDGLRANPPKLGFGDDDRRIEFPTVPVEEPYVVHRYEPETEREKRAQKLIKYWGSDT